MLDRIKKYILCFVLLFVPLLLSPSYAYPDLYFHNNFLTGISPYYSDGSIDQTGVYYYPNVDQSANAYTGFVTSFDNTYMSGNNPPSAVPLVDATSTIGKVFELPAGHTFCVYASDYSALQNSYVSDFVYRCALGYTKPISTNNNYLNNWVSIDSETPKPTKTWSQWHDIIYNTGVDAFYLNSVPYRKSAFIGVNEANDGTSSVVVQFFNPHSYPVYFTYSSELSEFPSSAPIYEVDSISYDSYSALYVNYGFDNSENVLFYMPYIDGKIDIYNDNKGINLPLGARFTIYSYSNINTSFFELDGNVACVGVDSSPYLNWSFCNSALINPQSEFIPFFLNTSIWQLSKQAVYIKDGYIAINNYDELVSKLQQAGIGQADLTRVIELLEEINSGGEKGEEVSELIGILEQYHDQLQNQANFASATGVFDTYKNILEFSSDMHWLITANNALFDYFTGFIMMCAMFLFLGRVMR